MGKRKRKSRKELKPGFSTRQSALEQHTAPHGTASGKSHRTFQRWLLKDTTKLRRSLSRPKGLSFDQIQREHGRILRVQSFDPYVLDAFELIYNAVRDAQLLKLFKALEGPEHVHALVPLSKRILNGSSKARRKGLKALQRLAHPAACDVAEVMFSQYGRSTQIACADVIGECGMRSHAIVLDAMSKKRVHKGVLHAIEQAMEKIEARFPTHMLQAGEGALSVTSMVAQAGALSLDGQAGRTHNFDMHAQMHHMITTHRDERVVPFGVISDIRWVDLDAPPRTLTFLVKAALAWGGIVRVLVLGACFALGAFAPNMAFAVCMVTCGVALMAYTFHTVPRLKEYKFLMYGLVVDARIESDDSGYSARFQRRRGREHIRSITSSSALFDAPPPHKYHAILLQEDCEEVMLAMHVTQVDVAESGELKVRNWSHLLVLLTCMVCVVGRLVFIIFG